MSLGNLLFLIFIVLFFVVSFLLMLIFIFELIDKQKAANTLLRVLALFVTVAGFSAISSLVILFFELV